MVSNAEAVADSFLPSLVHQAQAGHITSESVVPAALSCQKPRHGQKHCVATTGARALQQHPCT